MMNDDEKQNPEFRSQEPEGKNKSGLSLTLLASGFRLLTPAFHRSSFIIHHLGVD
jgi:hypothetical protein